MTDHEPLRPGDPVTLVLPDHVVMATVDVSDRLGFKCVLTSRGSERKQIVSNWHLDEEGIGWLRGYFTADSPEVSACRTAAALSEKTKPAPMAPQLPTAPIGGFGSYTTSSGGGSSVSIDEAHIKDLFDKWNIGR